MSLILKALPLISLRSKPSFFLISSISNSLHRTVPLCRAVFSASASSSPLIQAPTCSASETVASSSSPRVDLKECCLEWVSRNAFCGELCLNDVGKRVLLCGWVALHRVHGGLTFLNLRDHTGIVQVLNY